MNIKVAAFTVSEKSGNTRETIDISFVCFSSYLFIGPNTIRPGRDFTIQGSLLEYPTEPVTLTATLRKAGTEVASTQARVSDKNGE